MRDVVQNHVLQLLALVALDLPEADDDRRGPALALLRAVRRPSVALSRRGRSTAGRLAGTATDVPDHTAEPGVDPARGTETYAPCR